MSRQTYVVICTEKQIEKSHNVVHPEDNTEKQIEKSHNEVHPEDNTEKQIEKLHNVRNAYATIYNLRARKSYSRSKYVQI